MRAERHRGRSLHTVRGFTLMEMLIVIVILGAITSVMIPVMVSASDARRMREAARLVNTMLSAAQSRAISSGRSVGVMFQPIKNKISATPVKPAAAMDLYLVESPPPYAGDASNSAVRLKVSQATIRDKQGRPELAWNATIQPNYPSDTGWTSIRPGDVIRFNFRGETFYVDPGDQNDTVPLSPPVALRIIPTDASRVIYDYSNPQNVMPYLTDPTVLPALVSATPAGITVSFQIFRQPIKTMDPPVQLTDGTAVDLYFSGIDIAPASPPTSVPTACVLGSMITTVASAINASPVIVTFSPTGTLDQVYFPATDGSGRSTTKQIKPLSGVYILVGKVDRIPNTSISTNLNFTDPKAPPNYEDPDCRWVSVTRQSGLVTTTETVNLGNPPPLPGSTLSQQDIQKIMQSRRYATSNQASNGQ